MMLAPADSVFSLVYASVSDPHVLYEDHTFGGVTQISDGSGIALVAVSDADALCELLQLPPQDLETVYQAAAQSSDGKLVWKQRSRQDGAIQLTGAQDLLGVAVTAVTRSTVLSIEGVLQSTETVTADEAVMRSIVKQTVRLGGRDCAVNRYTTATISALKMSRMTAAEWSWKLIESLAVI
ncbi:hypothetical protein GGI11_001164 [Coemansia sp. RSA 2049]|nr:hypothetical protein GGI11_001164 [Coemansia sp. RSA 2049]